jgi:predicted dehydrogenase
MRNLDRRDFLNESALLASAAALLASGDDVLAAPKTADVKGPASDKLRVAVCGVRGQGFGHVRSYAGKNNCVITTICDADKGVIGNAMKHCTKVQGKEPRYEQDVRKVVADKDIDVISIATPNHWHALIAIWALQNGKHVYVEKPVSHNVLEGRRIVEASRKYNRICQTGTQSRSAGKFREAIAFMQSGKLGKVKLSKGLCYKRRKSIGKVTGPQEPPKTLDYDLWCGPAPKKPLMRKSLHYDWHWVWDTGNGDLGNQGIHEMDKARWGLGKNALPRSVMSVGGRLGYVDDGETPNTQVIYFDYGDCELIFEVRGWPSISPYPGKLSPQTPKGDSERWPNFIGNIYYCEDGIMVSPNDYGGVAYSKDGEVIRQFKTGGENHFANFLKAVRSGKREDQTADIEEGHLSSALCHLGNISHRVGSDEEFGRKETPFGIKVADECFAAMTDHLKANKINLEGVKYRVGKKLNLDPTKESFLGAPEADKLLTREYRAGFVVPDKV